MPNNSVLTNEEKRIRLVGNAVLKTENGKLLLQLLKRRYLTKPVCPPGSAEGYGYFREGENSVIRYLDQLYKYEDVSDE